MLELSQPLDWEEFMAGVRQAHAVAGMSTHNIALVVWAKSSFPEGLALWRFNSVFRAQPGNLRQTIIVVEKPSPMLMFAKQLAGIVRNLYPTKSMIYFASSMQEAVALSASAAGVQAKTGSSASENRPTAS